MKSIRLSKIAMALMVASLGFMVTLNNILDYGSNYAFVKHVLSMDSVFPDSVLKYRAITDELIWNVGYWLIIACEGLICLFFLLGAAALWRARNAPGAEFNQAKKWIYVGATVAMAVWFFGFMVVAGEWFLMWQSPEWNGQPAAFRFYISALGVLIYINQTDADSGSLCCK